MITSLPELFQQKKREVYEELARKPKTATLSPQEKKRLSDNLPPCIRHILTALPPKSDTVNFNKLTMVLVTYFKMAGVEEKAAMTQATTFIGKYQDSETYDTMEKRLKHWEDQWKYLQSNGEYKFDCSYIKGLGLPGSAFECSACDFHNSLSAKGESKIIDIKPHQKPKDFNLTDYGNSERLVSEHGQDLHYCFPFRKWFIWDGACWQEDTTGEIKRRAKDTVRTLYKQAANEPDDKTRKGIASYAVKCEAQQKINAMISMAESELPLPVLPDQLDQHPFLITCNNGTVDLRTNDLLPHNPDHLITRKIPFSYNMEARCPKWEAHLNLIMGGDKELISFLRRGWGSSLSGDTRDRKLFIEYGSGKNGKSVCNNTIAMMLGEYAMRTPVSTLLKKRGETIPNDVARLKGARFVYASEADQRRTLSEALVKDITGGEKIAARFMRGEWFEFQPEFKIWLGTNYKPTIKETADAIWDRIALIPFTVRIPDEKQKSMKELLEEFRQEGEGILRWLITGCYEWYHEGLRPPHKVTQATSDYRNDMDTLKQFISDRCIVREDLKCKMGDLYKSYCEWSDSNGDKPMAKRHFADSLTERGFTACRYQRVRGRSGIALLTNENEEEEHETT